MPEKKTYKLRVLIGHHRLGTKIDPKTNEILQVGRNVGAGETFEDSVNLAERFPEKFALEDGPGVQEQRLNDMSTEALQAELSRRTGIDYPKDYAPVPDQARSAKDQIQPEDDRHAVGTLIEDDNVDAKEGPQKINQQPAEDEDDDTYESMTVTELRDYAKEEGVSISSGDNKAEIIRKIKKAQK